MLSSERKMTIPSDPARTPVTGQAFDQFLDGQLADPAFKAGFEKKLAKVKSIAEVLRLVEQARERDGIPKAEIARRMRRRPEAISRLLAGQGSNPTLDTLIDLIDAIGLELDPDQTPTTAARERLLAAEDPLHRLSVPEAPAGVLVVRGRGLWGASAAGSPRTLTPAGAPPRSSASTRACSAHTINIGAVPTSGQAHRPDHSLADHTLARARYHVVTMIVTYTAAGTPVIDLTPEEYAAHLEREVRSATGMSVAEFTRAYTAGELEDGDVAVDEMVSLLRIGQNGHKAAA